MKLNDFAGTSVSLESIKNQSTVFFKELTMIYEDFVGMKRREIHESDFTKRLQACILHHMGFHAQIDIGNARNEFDDCGYAALIIPPMISQHLMSARQAREVGDAATKLSFDVVNARVRGDTKTIPLRLYVDMRLLTKTLVTAKEHAAITLHELGHFFTILLYTARLAKTNIALEMVAKDFDNSKTVEERKFVYERYMGSIISIALTGAEVYETDDKTTMVSLVYRSLNKAVADELGSAEYGYNMFEYAADMYATRHGAGVDLATGLEKITRGQKEQMTANRAAATVTYFLPVVIVLVKGGLTAAGILAAAPLAMISTLLLLSAVAIPHPMEYRYDTMRDRLRRIRNQVQMRMRLATTSKRELDIAKGELKTLDEMIARIDDGGSTFEFWLAIMVSPTVRRRNRQAELQMFYEDLAYNKLFEKSMELKYA